MLFAQEERLHAEEERLQTEIHRVRTEIHNTIKEFETATHTTLENPFWKVYETYEREATAHQRENEELIRLLGRLHAQFIVIREHLTSSNFIGLQIHGNAKNH